MNDHDREREIGQRIRTAGRRPEVPADDLAALRETAERAWLEKTTAPDREPGPGAWIPWAVAATLLIVAAGGWWAWRDAADGTGAVAGVVAIGEEAVPVGATLVADEPMALRLAGGPSLRIDRDSEVRIVSEVRLELIRGALYVDSPPRSGSARPIEVGTPLGTVREIGTQFSTRLTEDGDALRVRVREGRVTVRGERGDWTVWAGEEFTLGASGDPRRDPLRADAAAWDWVVALAPAFDLDDASLADYLEWLGRETGWRIRFADRELAGRATEIRLHGTIEGLRPDATVDVVLPSAGLAYRLEDGELTVQKR